MLFELSVCIQESSWVELLGLFEDLRVMQDGTKEGEDLRALRGDHNKTTNIPHPAGLQSSRAEHKSLVCWGDRFTEHSGITAASQFIECLLCVRHFINQYICIASYVIGTCIILTHTHSQTYTQTH